MKNLLKFIVTLILGIIMGYYISDTAILSGTWAGDTLEEISVFLQNPNPTENEPVVENETSSGLSNVFVTDSDNTAADVDLELVEQLIFDKLNNLRAEKGLTPLTHNNTLQAAARQRSVESAETFSHTRPDGTTTFTILDEPEFYYPYSVAGENLGMATFLKDEEYMADVLFQGWVDSPDHYQAMINADFQEVGIGAYMESGILYATQYFGTPAY